MSPGPLARAVPVVEVAGIDDVDGVALVLGVCVEAEELLVADDGEGRGDGVELVDLEVGVVLGAVTDEVGDDATVGDVVAATGGRGGDAELAVDAGGVPAEADTGAR